jgi:phage terminase large subunit
MIIFRGMDDPEKIKSVQGINRIWIEEATELKKEDFNQLDLRLRGKKEIQMTATFNPISAEHWLNTDFWKF